MRSAVAVLLPLGACVAVDVPGALAPRVDACDGGGGRIEALGTLAVDVGDASPDPWRAEVLVKPGGDRRVDVETFACVLDEGVQVATWRVVFQLPLRLDAPLDLVGVEDAGVDGLRGTLVVHGDDGDDVIRLGSVATAQITAFDPTVGELVGTLDVTADAARAASVATLSARFALAW